MNSGISLTITIGWESQKANLMGLLFEIGFQRTAS